MRREAHAWLRAHLGRATPRLIGTLHGTDVTHFGKEPEIGVCLAKDFNNPNALVLP
jgi:hypothetical protein